MNEGLLVVFSFGSLGWMNFSQFVNQRRSLCVRSVARNWERLHPYALQLNCINV
jgi:hypothetical protein